MSMRNQAGIVLPGYNALKVANAPTIGTATVISGTSVSVAFTAPACVGGGAISSYSAYCTTTGTNIATGASSPLAVTGLTTGTAYTFKVVAANAYGPSYPSAASNSATPAVIGQQAYTSAGTYSWVAPTGVTSVSVVAVGGGGGQKSGGGGGLGYINNLCVTPGSTYTVVVGNANTTSSGGTSYFVNSSTVAGFGGSTSGAGGSYTGTGGGTGGKGSIQFGDYGGGGGAGGYAGAGGDGSKFNTSATAGSGGGGGGGKGWSCCGFVAGGGGGGVGILGQGANGAAGTGSNPTCAAGKGGSGGDNGLCRTGGLYGGGAGTLVSGCAYQNVSGAAGAVRIIWPGTTRSFPSTCTGNL